MARPFNPDLIPESAPVAYSVSEINALARRLLERNFQSIYVTGEVTNLSLQPSGHVYFTLKDAESQLDAVMWREAAEGLAFRMESGIQVLCLGDLTLYTRRGRFQLSVRTIEPRGAGALELAYKQLRDRLEGEMLFAEEHKRPLPFLPGRIALVTSLSGAAVKDMLKSIYSRFSRARVAVYPVPVQGAGAAAEIAAALDALNYDGGFDVIVVGRGGGSLEDLWAFNEEAVARAIYRSRIPVVSAVGHERDVTIADMVADARAMTPTEVGRLVVPVESELVGRVEELREELVLALARRARRAGDDLAYAWRHPVFTHPMTMLAPHAQRIDDALRHMEFGLERAAGKTKDRLGRAGVRLEALSPLSVLARGFSVTRVGGAVLSDAAGVREGDFIETILRRGRITSRVTKVTGEEGHTDGQKGKEGDV